MINSRANAKIKEIKRLYNKKYREETSSYIVEGIKMVREAIIANQPIKAIVGVPEVLQTIEFCGGEIIEVSKEVFDSITDEVNPQGILAVIGMPKTKPKKAKGKCLLLDGVSDPGNMGTIIRTAAASGYKDIYLINTVSPFNPKAVRASMSGIYFVNLYNGSADEILGVIDVPIISADMSGEDVFAFKKPNEFCLVIGNEANGISDEVRGKSKYTIKYQWKKQLKV